MCISMLCRATLLAAWQPIQPTIMLAFVCPRHCQRTIQQKWWHLILWSLPLHQPIEASLCKVPAHIRLSNNLPWLHIMYIDLCNKNLTSISNSFGKLMTLVHLCRHTRGTLVDLNLTILTLFCNLSPLRRCNHTLGLSKRRSLLFQTHFHQSYIYFGKII